MVPVEKVMALPPSSPLTTSHATSVVAPLTVCSNEGSDYDNNNSATEQSSEIHCEQIAGTKTTKLFDLSEDLGSGDSSDVCDVGESGDDGGGGNDELELLDDDDLPTNAEVSIYSFHQCLTHYMEGMGSRSISRTARLLSL
jgi:hypothetical protein